MRKFISSMWGGPGTPRTAAIGPHHIATSIRRGPVLWLILCGVLLVAAIMIGTAVMVGEFRERALSNGERELENTVLLLTRHFDQQFEDSEIIANDLIAQMQFSGIASPEIFQSRMSTSRRAPDAEVQGQRACPISATSMIFDADGNADQFIRRRGRCPTVNIADRAYFKAFKSNPQSTHGPGRTGSQLFYRRAGPRSSPIG